MGMEILNIAAYRFVPVPNPGALRDPLRALCLSLGLKGTILLAPEGINLFLAGERGAIDRLLATLDQDERFLALFAHLTVKRSVSNGQPFRRMLVRIKQEIITMRHPALVPAEGRAPAITPAQLAKWLAEGHDDEGRPILLLDTRNRFEVELGTFENAKDLAIRRFGEFPDAYRTAIAEGALDPLNQHIVTFCTGGIRCEKAALFLAEEGATSVSQLEGGILKYFEEVGSAHWQGECFVFDDRVALDPALTPTATVQCYACRAVVSPLEQRDDRYQIGVSCPHCAPPRHVIQAESSSGERPLEELQQS
jgi:UPF0176 protein